MKTMTETNKDLVLRFDEKPVEKPSIILNFGRFKGHSLGSVPINYLKWLAEPGTDHQGKAYKIPADISQAAKTIVDQDNSKLTEALLAGRDAIADETIYVIERLGDLDDNTDHKSLDAAFAYLCLEYPIEDHTDFGGETTEGRSTPDPEHDRILIWEILPSGHKKVLEHFSGWHWNADEFGIPQMTLPGDEKPLIDLAMQDY
jgi:hypothetical protein